ncbi:MAG: hypothetical protein QW165_00205 [Candidatus Woesearchaeota archaeon]
MDMEGLIRRFWTGKNDRELEAFLSSAGFKKTQLDKQNRLFEVSNPAIIVIPSPGKYDIIMNLDNIVSRNTLMFKKKGTYAISPVIRRMHPEMMPLGSPSAAVEEFASLRILRLGSQQCYEYARDLAAKNEQFEYAARFRDKAKKALKDDSVGAPPAERKSPVWKYAVATAAATILAGAGVLVSYQMGRHDAVNRKLDVLIERVPSRDYIPALSPTEIKYAEQFGMAADLDMLVKATIAKNPKITDAEAGFRYLYPVHDEREGKYNFYINAKEVQLNILIAEHTGDIKADDESERKIAELGLGDIYQKIKERIWNRKDRSIAAEIRQERALAKEALPWQESLSKEYGSQIKVIVEHVKPAPLHNAGEIAGVKCMKMKLDNAILNYTIITFYTKIGEEPVTKIPLYERNAQELIEGFSGTLQLEDKVFAHFNAGGMYAVSTGSESHKYIENNDSPKPEEHWKLLQNGLSAYEKFVSQYDINKFIRAAKEWAGK